MRRRRAARRACRRAESVSGHGYLM
jgi:hypothetical protein